MREYNKEEKRILNIPIEKLTEKEKKILESLMAEEGCNLIILNINKNRCIYHNEEILQPTSAIFRFTEEQKQKFRELFGFNLPIQEEFVCMKCGQLYDKDFRKLNLKLGVLNGRNS
jgi:hypothetical protein